MVSINPIECPSVPGHYQIPGFSNYSITLEGQVFSNHSYSYLEGSVNPDGYHNFRLTGDNGHVLTWGRHRLLGFVFKHPGVPIEDLVVNHINGIKGDDRLDNLEWTTYQGNQEHAGQEGLTEKCIPISVRDVVTGEITNYPSMLACALVSGLSKDAIAYRVKIGQERIFPEKKQYRPSSENGDWYIPTNVDKEMLTNGTSKKVQVRFLISNIVLEFEKMSDLANHLNIAPSTITMWINHPDQPVLPGYIQLQKSSEVMAWRDVEDPYLELDSFTGKRSVVVTNTTTGLKQHHASAAECARAMGIKETALNYRLKSKGTVTYSDQCTYCYYSDSL